MNDLSTLFETANRASSEASKTPSPLRWGAPTAAERGPVIATSDPVRNAIRTHAGCRRVAVPASPLRPNPRPDLTDTAPADLIGPHPQWLGDIKIVSLDPWGH